MSKQLERANLRGALKLGVVFVGMFAFSFALIPLYGVLCDITGLGGRTGVVQASDIDADTVDEERWVQVQFLATTNSQLPWDFAPSLVSMRIRPGKIYATEYRAHNRANVSTNGQAVPNVSPPVASKYFNKTECFCFDNQTLTAGETKSMPVRFVIDKALPKSITHVTLSYTFFRIGEGTG
ncbi:MAG: cytochrome c oxidase assembly protein [Chromatiales bacterium]|jgi:cytochrome c oxidase assembly protein subunit 11|nr:cytochrome c oxidase assembly protein [Chromatiales bacterium]